MNTTNTPEFERRAQLEDAPSRRANDGRAGADGNGEGALATLLEAAVGAVMEQLRESKAGHAGLTAQMETIARTTASNADLLAANSQAIARLQTAMTDKTRDSALPPAELARVEAQLGQLNRANNAHAHNLDQLRLQAEGLARSFEKLSPEVIQRQVMDPLFVGFARVYEAVYALTGREDSSSDDLQPILSRIRSFLEDYNIELIHPDDGEPVDPRRHQPAKQFPTPDAGLHARIATTFNVGLAHGTRVIQPARVGVFTFAESASANSAKP
jgi:molecular chaperone GrpE (heat shock protein)